MNTQHIINKCLGKNSEEPKECPSCNGDGVDDDGNNCTRCKGAGNIWVKK